MIRARGVRLLEDGKAVWILKVCINLEVYCMKCMYMWPHLRKQVNLNLVTVFLIVIVALYNALQDCNWPFGPEADYTLEVHMPPYDSWFCWIFRRDFSDIFKECFSLKCFKQQFHRKNIFKAIEATDTIVTEERRLKLFAVEHFEQILHLAWPAQKLPLY